jgi:hypothetical protein
MIEFNNSEDQGVWACLEDFDFNNYPDYSKLRIELYLALIKSIGYCGSCTAFTKQTGYCSTLKIFTNAFERCSDFDAVEEESESAFDIMSEEFRREQENLNNFAKIRKYQRRPSIIRKDDKNGKKP